MLFVCVYIYVLFSNAKYYMEGGGEKEYKWSKVRVCVRE